MPDQAMTAARPQADMRQPMDAAPMASGDDTQQGAAVSPQMEQANPQEQAAYNQFVGNGMKMIYSRNTFPEVLRMLETGDDPVAALAQTATTVVGRVALSAVQNGVKPSGDVLLHGGTELFEELADVATKAGIHDFAKDPDGMEGALFQAMDKFRAAMQSAGLLNRDAAQRDMQQLSEMDKNGQLGPMFMEMARNSRSGAPQQQVQGPDNRGLGAAMAGRAM